MVNESGVFPPIYIVGVAVFCLEIFLLFTSGVGSRLVRLAAI